MRGKERWTSLLRKKKSLTSSMENKALMFFNDNATSKVMRSEDHMNRTVKSSRVVIMFQSNVLIVF